MEGCVYVMRYDRSSIFLRRAWILILWWYKFSFVFFLVYITRKIHERQSRKGKCIELELSFFNCQNLFHWLIHDPCINFLSFGIFESIMIYLDSSNVCESIETDNKWTTMWKLTRFQIREEGILIGGFSDFINYFLSKFNQTEIQSIS